MIGIAYDLQVFFNESFMNESGYGIKNDLCFQIIENSIQPFELLGVFGKEIKRKSFVLPAFQVPDQQIKLTIESGLFFCMKFYFKLIAGSRTLIAELYYMLCF